MGLNWASLTAPEARERDLEVRYERIRRYVDVAGARAKLAKIKNAGFQDLLMRLDDIGAIVGADAVFAKDLARAQPRLGLTLALPSRAPLIWLNLLKHDGVADLVDTVVHEAIHATVLMLRRLPRTPQPDEEIAYHGEEIVALTGANWILNRIDFPAKRQTGANLVAIDAHTARLDELGCAQGFMRARAAEGIAAAAYLTNLTEQQIRLDEPTAEEVRARRPRR